jgi:hypothetical protein
MRLLEYNTHNIFGTMMSVATREAMLARRPARPRKTYLRHRSLDLCGCSRVKVSFKDGELDVSGSFGFAMDVNVSWDALPWSEFVTQGGYS